MLDPEYGEQPTKMLDSIEFDPGRKDLWNAIQDAVDLICDHPDSAEARIEQVRLFEAGIVIRVVPVRRVATEDDDWIVMWKQDGDVAVISYIGPRP